MKALTRLVAALLFCSLIHAGIIQRGRAQEASDEAPEESKIAQTERDLVLYLADRVKAANLAFERPDPYVLEIRRLWLLRDLPVWPALAKWVTARPETPARLAPAWLARSK